jgi:hypothetical protein
VFSVACEADAVQPGPLQSSGTKDWLRKLIKPGARSAVMAATRLASALLVLTGAVLLSGCTASNGPNGQQVTAPGSIAYNGASTGTQTSPPFPCDGSGAVHFGANLGSGTATVTVEDSGGKAVYTKMAGAPGQTDDSKDVSGAAGEWTITAVRSSSGGVYGGSGFSGQYTVTVEC